MPKTEKLYLDTETFSELPIKKVGTYQHANNCELLLLTYAVGDGPEQAWDPEQEAMPAELEDNLADERVLRIAHHAVYDRQVLGYTLGDEAPLDRWFCTMAQAMAHGYPGALDQLCAALGMSQDQSKLADGKKLIELFCSPAPKNHNAYRYDKYNRPDEWGRFVVYGKRDITAMRAAHKRLPTTNYPDREYALWLLDQKINDRGFLVDLQLAEAGRDASAKEKRELTTRFGELTGGLTPGQRDKTKALLNGMSAVRERHGLLDNTQKSTMKVLELDDQLPPAVREIASLVQRANKTSTAKYGSIIPRLNDANELQGGLRYSGATRTQRWSGQGFQPHNLASRGLPPQAETDAYIDGLKAGTHDLAFDNHMWRASAALRGLIIARPGKKLVCSDLSNIEGRKNAWFAREGWKLRAFSLFDRGEGPDLYNVTAGGILGKGPYDIKDWERSAFGKVPELALGYQGGVGALQKFAKDFGIKFVDYWDNIQGSVNPVHVGNARMHWEKWGHTGELSAEEWIASETVKLAWRAKHPKIVGMWRLCQDAAINALSNQNRPYQVGPYLEFRYTTIKSIPYLVIKLPSGHCLFYCRPFTPDGREFRFWGFKEESGRRQWCEQTAYGGLFVENICQASARDVLAHNMPSIEAAGYKIVLTVHDEDVTEAPDTAEYNAEHLSKLMSRVPPWAKGLPLASAGFEAYRYKK